MTTWQHSAPFRKERGEKWPVMDHFYAQRKAVFEQGITRRRKRYWRENGARISECVKRCARALNA